MDRNRRPRLANRNKSNSRLRESVSAALERLEERMLLTATPIITEFLADNTSGLVDNHGHTSDWIEIYNPTSGIAIQSTTSKLLGTGALVKTFVPTNGNLGNTWTSNSFVDSSWRQGTTGVGYDTSAVPPPTTQWAVRMVNTAAGPMNTIA